MSQSEQDTVATSSDVDTTASQAASKPKTVTKKASTATTKKSTATKAKTTVTKKTASVKKAATSTKKATATTKKAATTTKKVATKTATTAKGATTTVVKKAATAKPQTSKAKSKKSTYVEKYAAVGRRKSSTARVYLRPESKGGKIIINGKPIETYFGRETSRMVVWQPLVLLDVVNQFNVVVTVSGGGISGQAGAIRHGITRALLRYEAANSDKIAQDKEADGDAGSSGGAVAGEKTATLKDAINVDDAALQVVSTAQNKRNTGWRLKLRSAKFVTRDARSVERKKCGRRKARRGTQFSKR